MDDAKVGSVSRMRSPLLLGLAVIGIGLAIGFAPPRLFLGTTMADPRNPIAAPVDGDRAFGYLKAICDLGPRPAGSDANTRQRSLVAAHFVKAGGKVSEQAFTAKDPISGAPVAMANLVGSWYPERTERVVLGAHYDTRPFPDQEKDPAKRRAPFIGANDGASGVALLMEISNHLATSTTPWGVDLVLFDGEELVYGEQGDYFLGSKEFARRYVEAEGGQKANHYVAGIVLDMVGDKDLRIDQEQYSLDLAQALMRDLWTVAAKLKESKTFPNRVGRAVNDDHLPLNNAGIPTIDLIDFDYPHWHTTKDIPANCSGASLAKVGRVVTGWLSLPKLEEKKKRP